MVKAKTAKVTTASKVVRATRISHVLNNILRQCEVHGVYTKKMLREASQVLRCDHKSARRQLAQLEARGAHRVVPHRGVAGTFIPTPCPTPSIGKITSGRPLTKLRTALLADFVTIPLRSALSNGTGPESKFLEIRTNNSIATDDAGYHAQLMPWIPACRALLQQALTAYVGYPHDVPGVPELPFRIFACLYPAGDYSGMGAHHDTHAGYGALALALTDDYSPATSFYTATDIKGTTSLDWPLRAGHAVAICPSYCHGVRAYKRPVDRLTITMYL